MHIIRYTKIMQNSIQKSSYSQDFLAKQKEKLETELSTLQAKSDSYSEVRESQEINPEEAAGEVAERFNTQATGAFENKKIEEIKGALLRIDDGVYGKCLNCNAWIPEGRLEFVPTATKCANC